VPRKKKTHREVVKKVRGRFKRKGDRSVRKIAKELDVSTTVESLLKND
jgi:hypothetical protein